MITSSTAYVETRFSVLILHFTKLKKFYDPKFKHPNAINFIEISYKWFRLSWNYWLGQSPWRNHTIEY